MQTIVSLFLFLIWMIGIPIVIGGSLLDGCLFMFALMEIMALPMIFFKLPLHVLASSYSLLLLGAAALRVFGKRRAGRPGLFLTVKERFEERDLIYMVCIILTVIIAVFLGLYTHLDADDSFFVGAAVTDAATDTIFRYDPYTGFAYEVLPMRYTLSPFPVFTAVMSRICGQVHPAVMAHMFAPPVFFLMLMEVMDRFGRLFFPEDRKAHSWFLFFSILLFAFSSWSIYNSGNFMMIRSWQGKAALGGILLPFLFCNGFGLILDRGREGSWITLWLTVFSGCLISSMGIILCPIALGILALLAVISRKKEGIVKGIGFLAAALPCIILGILYLTLW